MAKLQMLNLHKCRSVCVCPRKIHFLLYFISLELLQGRDEPLQVIFSFRMKKKNRDLPSHKRLDAFTHIPANQNPAASRLLLFQQHAAHLQ